MSIVLEYSRLKVFYLANDVSQLEQLARRRDNLLYEVENELAYMIRFPRE